MRKPAFIILLAAVAATAAFGQAEQKSNPAGQTIERVEVSGISEDRLTAELRGDLHRLEGQRYESQAAEQLAARIQSELPDHVAAAKTMDGTQSGRVRLLFVVAEAPDDLGSNINQRYPVASVEIEGVPRTLI